MGQRRARGCRVNKRKAEQDAEDPISQLAVPTFDTQSHRGYNLAAAAMSPKIAPAPPAIIIRPLDRAGPARPRLPISPLRGHVR
jgi:hypothetical protein